MKDTLFAIIIAALFILWLVEKCAPDPPIPQPDPAIVAENTRLLERVAADSIAKVRDDSIQTALRSLAQSQADARRRSEVAAGRERARADSARVALALATTAQDSIPLLLTALEATETRADNLELALTSEKASHATDLLLLASVTAERDTAQIRRDEWRRLSEKWEDDFTRLALKSRPRWPSKAESFMAGVITGAALIVGIARISG